jgi:hypothetical protein
MRVLVISEKAATPKIHQYKFQKNCRLEVGPFGWSNATLPRFGSTRLLSRQAIYKQNQWETFLPERPLDLVGLACGMVAAPQNGSQLAAARRSPAPCVTI